MITIVLKHKKEESVKRFHPWVFSGAIDRMLDEEGAEVQPEEGDWVEVVSKAGDFLGIGQYQIGSIAVRLFTFGNEEFGEEFFLQRLQAAYDLRKSLGLIRPDNNAFRLVHGEGDGLPGLIIDVYDGTAVMQAHTQGIHYIREALAEDLMRVAGADIRNVYYKSETTLSYKSEARQTAEDGVNGYLIIDGKKVENREEGKALEASISDVAIENGLKFHVDWLKGQKTGFFVDQRENRALVEKFSKGRKVLNMFCYTGGFSFYAMRGGAELVHSVDVSQQAINFTNNNVKLNYPDDPRHEAFCEDAFHYLDRMGDQYDLIILDPSSLCQAQEGAPQCAPGLSPTECQGIREDPARRHTLHLLMLAGGHQGRLPLCRLQCSSPVRPSCAHTPSAPSACRPSNQYLSSRRRISEGPGAVC